MANACLRERGTLAAGAVKGACAAKLMLFLLRVFHAYLLLIPAVSSRFLCLALSVTRLVSQPAFASFGSEGEVRFGLKTVSGVSTL